MKRILNIAALAIFTLLPIGMNAQITYSSGDLNINNAPKHKYLGLTINKWLGMYWTCKTDNFFQLDISPANPRLAGTGDEVVFYNSETETFNSIQVANVYNYSDARAKDNIKPLTIGLDAVLHLRPVSYTWKPETATALSAIESSSSVANGPNEDGQIQYGFLAQEVETVLPDAVKTDEEGHKMINYTAIIPMLVQAVQELQATVEEQSAKIAELTNNSFVASNVAISPYKIVSCTPNPTTGQVTISTNLEWLNKSATIIISNLTGTTKKTLQVSSGSPSVTTNISDIESGMCVVSLFVNGELADSYRLIKQ
jgi:hypothetical protein